MNNKAEKKTEEMIRSEIKILGIKRAEYILRGVVMKRLSSQKKFNELTVSSQSVERGKAYTLLREGNVDEFNKFVNQYTEKISLQDMVGRQFATAD